MCILCTAQRQPSTRLYRAESHARSCLWRLLLLFSNLSKSAVYVSGVPREGSGGQVSMDEESQASPRCFLGTRQTDFECTTRTGRLGLGRGIQLLQGKWRYELFPSFHPFLSLFLSITLLRYNLHTITFFPLEVQLSILTRLCNRHHNLTPGRFLHPKWKPEPFSSHSPSHCKPPSPWKPQIYFLSFFFFFLEIIALFEKLTSRLLLCILKSHKEHPRKKHIQFP